MLPSVTSHPQDSRTGRAKRVDLVRLVYLLCLVQPYNETNQTNQSNQSGLMLHSSCSVAPADFFSILLTQRRTNPVSHIVRDRNHADTNDDMLRDDLPGRDLLGLRQKIAQHREQR